MKKSAIDVRQGALKASLIEELKLTPIVEYVCRKAGVSRSTFYRMKTSDASFAKQVQAALEDGRDRISDIAESQVLALINAGKFEAVRYWLNANSPRYAPKLQMSGSIAHEDVPLSAKKKALIRRAIKIASEQ